ncbi:MAG: hypothetical protein PHX61_10850 [Alphaproteobacteria bacterium]|nr:hypothetical protein [Alphaproteobacteria bacterium]
MALLNFNGVDLPEPTDYKVTQSDLDSADSGRSETGIMNRNRVRQGVAKIEASWKNLTAEEVSLICNAAQPSKIAVQYFFGGTHTASMYVGDRSCDLVSLESNGASYWNLSMNVVEY